MRINSVITYPQQQKKHLPKFGKADYFIPIKKIDGMICGCCGKKVLQVILQGDHAQNHHHNQDQGEQSLIHFHNLLSLYRV